MDFFYYFRECPTCKNHNLLMVRQAGLKCGEKIDERYILALPDVWGEEEKYLIDKGANTPFIYNARDKKILNVDYQKEGMLDEIISFLS